ncbi:MAG: metallophosphoesterase [Proteobacteria bacterium]|nr:metallophosphoesterase [Pseudomonadota bacterium]
MKVYAVSDLHVDYEENAKWLGNLSESDYQDDILILAGDVSDRVQLLANAFEVLNRRFLKVLFVPGNHDLWVRRDGTGDSFDKFFRIKALAGDFDISIEPLNWGSLSLVPLFGWYDYSFAPPSNKLKNAWLDFTACRWPEDFNESRITNYFLSLNESYLDIENRFVISFSHFVPRLDVMPSYIPAFGRDLYPVLGTWLLEKQIRKLGSQIHIYGHTHVNRQVCLDNTVYINNAFGYPHETAITQKKLRCIYDSDSREETV